MYRCIQFSSCIESPLEVIHQLQNNWIIPVKSGPIKSLQASFLSLQEGLTSLGEKKDGLTVRTVAQCTVWYTNDTSEAQRVQIAAVDSYDICVVADKYRQVAHNEKNILTAVTSETVSRPFFHVSLVSPVFPGTVLDDVGRIEQHGTDENRTPSFRNFDTFRPGKEGGEILVSNGPKA